MKLGKCYITQRKNNIFVVFQEGSKVIVEKSAGKLGYKGAGKRTRLAAELVGQAVGESAVKLSYKGASVYLKGGVTALTRGVVSGLVRSGLVVSDIYFIRSIAHNGVRPRKRRRV